MPSKAEYALLCLENPLLDIQGQGDAAMLEKYGLKSNDAILAEDKHMGIYDDLLNNRDAKLIAGGAAQNTARGAQYILPPSSVLYIGCVGADSTADTLRSACGSAGLHVEYLVDPVQPTGRCGVVITGHDRSLVTHLAAANEYKLSHLTSPEIWPLVRAARIYYVGGFHLTACVPAAMALAEEAAKENKVFVLNLSAPFIPQFFKEQLDSVLPYCDYVIGNETEAGAYAESHGLGGKSVSEIAAAIAGLEKVNKERKRMVVITQGTDETLVAVQGEEGLKGFKVHDLPKDEICDTNGAGDAFAGGFLAGLVENKLLEESIHMGQWLARLSIKELGPQYVIVSSSPNCSSVERAALLACLTDQVIMSYIKSSVGTHITNISIFFLDTPTRSRPTSLRASNPSKESSDFSAMA
ncbi:adenosine kinase [Xylographa bjoerkii]|nr:adenosine kinase [Xylographa bjoerkii]